jgi:hypothetical protein
MTKTFNTNKSFLVGKRFVQAHTRINDKSPKYLKEYVEANLDTLIRFDFVYEVIPPKMITPDAKVGEMQFFIDIENKILHVHANALEVGERDKYNGDDSLDSFTIDAILQYIKGKGKPLKDNDYITIGYDEDDIFYEFDWDAFETAVDLKLNGKVIVPKGTPISDWCDDSVLIEFKGDDRGLWIEPSGMDKIDFLKLKQEKIDNMEQKLITHEDEYEISMTEDTFNIGCQKLPLKPLTAFLRKTLREFNK